MLVESGLHEHRYPECWRCHTPLIFRIADDWFISVRDLRQQMLDANATVEWTPRVHGQAHGRLARATWATGTSRAAATTGCRCPSTRARAGT